MWTVLLPWILGAIGFAISVSFPLWLDARRTKRKIELARIHQRLGLLGQYKKPDARVRGEA
jgi:hypothetical protein